MLRKNYLLDQFYGQNDLFSNYHYPGEGNIRGFVGQNIEGAEALITFSNELIVSKNLYSVSTDLAAFVDIGTFWTRDIESSFEGLDQEVKSYIGGYNNRVYADTGLGIRFNTSIFEKDLYLRFDMPFYLYNDDLGFNLNKNNWIFSFQSSL